MVENSAEIGKNRGSQAPKPKGGVPRFRPLPLHGVPVCRRGLFDEITTGPDLTSDSLEGVGFVQGHGKERERIIREGRRRRMSNEETLHP